MLAETFIAAQYWPLLFLQWKVYKNNGDGELLHNKKMEDL